MAFVPTPKLPKYPVIGKWYVLLKEVSITEGIFEKDTEVKCIEINEDEDDILCTFDDDNGNRFRKSASEVPNIMKPM